MSQLYDLFPLRNFTSPKIVRWWYTEGEEVSHDGRTPCLFGYCCTHGADNQYSTYVEGSSAEDYWGSGCYRSEGITRLWEDLPDILKTGRGKVDTGVQTTRVDRIQKSFYFIDWRLGQAAAAKYLRSRASDGPLGCQDPVGIYMDQHRNRAYRCNPDRFESFFQDPKFIKLAFPLGHDWGAPAPGKHEAELESKWGPGQQIVAGHILHWYNEFGRLGRAGDQEGLRDLIRGIPLARIRTAGMVDVGPRFLRRVTRTE